MVSDEEKRRIAEMTDEERQAGLEKAAKGLAGDLLRIAVGLVLMWITWRLWF